MQNSKKHPLNLFNWHIQCFAELACPRNPFSVSEKGLVNITTFIGVVGRVMCIVEKQTCILIGLTRSVGNSINCIAKVVHPTAGMGSSSQVFMSNLIDLDY